MSSLTQTDKQDEIYLGITPFEAVLYDRPKHLASLHQPLAPETVVKQYTHDGTHVRLASGKFRKNMLHQKVLHAPLDLGMAHDERPQRRRDVQRPEFLRWRHVTGQDMVNH